MNVNHLILDYVHVCEKRACILDFGEFIDLWKIANEIAEDTAPDDRDLILAGIAPDVE